MIDQQQLLDYLDQLDALLQKKITLVAVGGTALCLMNLKESTKDVDFCAATKQEFEMIKQASKKVKTIFKIDLYHTGYIFCLQLPDDYIFRARSFPSNFKNISLKTLSPIDIIITKTGRLNQRDIEDIEAVIKNKKVDKIELIDRFNIIKKSIPSNDAVFEENFKMVLKEFF
ncbi:hypothetical protein J4232_04045 [Candidatus Woesearchaeota archaeon]|nr:hypothetical protein [Candidatus Woesearchaeota archaeon]